MPRGGYRAGAGRPGWRPLLEGCERVDVRRVAQASASRDQVHVGEQPVRLAWLPCHYGGEQPFFVCPRCERRRRSLYRRRGSLRYACRVCLGLAYSVECEVRIARVQRAKRKLEARLGPYGSKPATMRWQTFWRLRNRVRDLEREFESLLAHGLRKLRGG